jgi:hypothetical protein
MARWPRKSKAPLEQTTTDNGDGTMRVTWSKPKPSQTRGGLSHRDHHNPHTARAAIAKAKARKNNR